MEMDKEKIPFDIYLLYLMFHISVIWASLRVIYISMMKKQLVEAFTRALSSADINRLINIKISIQNEEQYRKLKEEKSLDDSKMLSTYYFCLALILDKTGKPQAHYYYQKAEIYDKNNPQICLCFSYYLLQKRNKMAIKYVQKIDFDEAIQYRQSITLLLQYIILVRGPQLSLSSKNKELNFIYQQSFGSLLSFGRNFNYKVIKGLCQIGPQSDIHIIQLAMIAFLQKRYDECLEWTNQIVDSNQVNILLYLGSILTALGKYEKSLIFYQKAVQIDSKDILGNRLLFHNFVALKQYKKAKQCAQKISELKFQANSDIIIQAKSYCTDGRHYQALLLLHQLFESEENYNKKVSILKKIGNQYLHLDQYDEAIKIYLILMRHHSNSDTYSILGRCFRKKKQYINAINFFKMAIEQDYCCTNSFVYLSQIVQQYKHFKTKINQFMQELKKENHENEDIKFNVALYYYLSKQESRQFYQIITQFLDNTRKQGSPDIISNIVSNTLIKYLTISRQTQQQNLIFSLIIGVLRRAKGDKTQAHESFMNLISRYETDKGFNFKTIFMKISQRLMIEGAGPFFFIFLQFVAIQMIQQSPKYAIQCYNSVLSLADNDFDKDFRNAFKIKLQQDAQNFDESAILHQSKMITDQIHSLEINSKSIINPNQLYKVVNQIAATFQRIQQLLESSLIKSSQMSINISQSLILQIEDQKFDLWSNIVGIQWNKMNHKCDDYNKINLQINQEEQNVRRRIFRCEKLYLSNSSKDIFLKRILECIHEYLQDDFIKNQMVKLVVNTFYPILPSNEKADLQLALTLRNIKNNPYYHAQNFRQDICDILFQEKNQINQQQDNHIELNQLISDESFESNELKQTSSYDFQNEPLQDFQTKGQRTRKYSDLQNIDQIDHQNFCKQLQKKNQKNQVSDINEQVQTQSNSSSESLNENSDMILQAQSYYNQPQSSHQLSKFDIDDEPYQKKYHVATNKFSTNCEKQRYKKFYQLLYINTYYTIRQLSKHAKKRHIAFHCVEDKIFITIGKKMNQLISKFTAKVQKGAVQFSRCSRIQNIQTLQGPQIRWLWQFGPTVVLKWIEDVALGIIELQQLGIYHADLAFRNTVFKIINKICVFKIIDFDKAFKVTGTCNDEAYQTTRQMIEFWLRFQYHQQRKGSDQDSSSSQTQYDIFQIIEYMINKNNQSKHKQSKDQYHSKYESYEKTLVQQFLMIKQNVQSFSKLKESTDMCMGLLQQHMHKSHLHQFVTLIENLLHEENRKAKEDIIVNSKIERALEQANSLKNGKIDYLIFSTKLRRIRESKTINGIIDNDYHGFALQQLPYQVDQL